MQAAGGLRAQKSLMVVWGRGRAHGGSAAGLSQSSALES